MIEASSSSDATLIELIREAEADLERAGIETARLDAEVLLAAVLGADRSSLYARLRNAAGPESAARFRAAVARRRAREPVAYITGVQEFWSLPFAVTQAVLIPRPETELLVEMATPRLTGHSAPAICDIGTGSGCVAIALARELPAARLTALDTSTEALAMARRNASAHGVASRIAFLESDLFAGVGGERFDAIVSNPPYLGRHEHTPPELAYEPRLALFAGDDDLDVIRRLITAAPARLQPGGWLIMECGAAQAAAVQGLAARAGLGEIAVVPDLAGLPRVLVARRPIHTRDADGR